jgi:hypothetical protein
MIKSIHKGKHGLSKRKYDNLHFHKIWYIKELITNASIKTTIMKIPGDKWFPHLTLLVAYLQSSSFTSVFKNYLSMKEGCLFFFVTLKSPKSGQLLLHFWYGGKSLND